MAGETLGRQHGACFRRCQRRCEFRTVDKGQVVRPCHVYRRDSRHATGWIGAFTEPGSRQRGDLRHAQTRRAWKKAVLGHYRWSPSLR